MTSWVISRKQRDVAAIRDYRSSRVRICRAHRLESLAADGRYARSGVRTLPVDSSAGDPRVWEVVELLHKATRVIRAGLRRIAGRLGAVSLYLPTADCVHVINHVEHTICNVTVDRNN